MTQRTAFHNDNFVPESDLRLSIYDLGFTMGCSVFEVTRTFHHEPYKIGSHLTRLMSSAQALGIPVPMSEVELEDVTREVLARNLNTEPQDVDWSIIHNLTPGLSPQFASEADSSQPTVVITCHPITSRLISCADAFREGVESFVAKQLSMPGDVLDASIKTHNRLHYHLAQQEDPSRTAVLTDQTSHVTETPSGNIFVVNNGKLRTPFRRNVLAGVTRAETIRLAKSLGLDVGEANITPAQLIGSDELFVTSTSIGLLHIRSVDGHLIRDGAMGPVSAQIRESLFAEFGVDIAEQASSYREKYA